MRRGLGLAALLLAGSASAADLTLRPQGPDLTRAVQQALAELSTPGLPLRLVTTGGPALTLGSSSGVPFNPDVAVRTVGQGAQRRIEINPQGPLTLNVAVRQALAQEFELDAWTPEAARLRFSGADLNGDGAVDLTDLALLMSNLGGSGRGDLNGDRQVDDADLKLFAEAYQLP
ncbi:hypothetical protein Deipr_1198 [Deinococcus proteolyticus MRP]|uniref:EF-hand domain-containing protein n=1 Tax=Deinococcus proteolyticus (strain ATCC 35074 / DSM 20540 / JCM 6276 / NBRC 101906 / NCIMB 13154 / VKM Ac-1939 / CCM 2703 / MRP) TaxID=693977 RepID=F0RNM3_DEIPM|nr:MULTISPECIES: hypothetical protein [Deinococcus]ADY26349.1 hypothetical protein Deipr_1198 [Deinococcus proteolyticus MRP]MCY1702468.1 hypothetical protein [Deinococcus sp. SL84]